MENSEGEGHSSNEEFINNLESELSDPRQERVLLQAPEGLLDLLTKNEISKENYKGLTIRLASAADIIASWSEDVLSKKSYDESVDPNDLRMKAVQMRNLSASSRLQVLQIMLSQKEN